MNTALATFGGMLIGALAADLDKWSHGLAFWAVMGGWLGYGLYLLVKVPT